MTKNLISIEKLNKTYKNGFAALKKVNLNIKEGEIFALLGPFKKRFQTINKPINGFKTSTLISFADSTLK